MLWQKKKIFPGSTKDTSLSLEVSTPSLTIPTEDESPVYYYSFPEVVPMPHTYVNSIYLLNHSLRRKTGDSLSLRERLERDGNRVMYYSSVPMWEKTP